MFVGYALSATGHGMRRTERERIMSVEYRVLTRRIRAARNMDRLRDIERGWVRTGLKRKQHKKKLRAMARAIGGRVAKLRGSIEHNKP